MWEGLATMLLPGNPKTIETQICDFLYPQRQFVTLLKTSLKL